MAVVATAAMSCAFVAMQRRSQSYRARAEYRHAAKHQLEMDCRPFFCGYGISAERAEAIARERALEQKLLEAAAAYHHALELKYRAAARRPWSPIEADPPPPPKGNPKLVSADDY
jgi:hypothetical protein